MKYVISLMLLLLVACDDFFYQPADADKMLGVSRKIVVNSILNPDADSIHVQAVWLKTVKEAGATGFDAIADAAVTLSDGARSIVLPYRGDKYSVQQSAMPLLEGTTYYLEVKVGSQTAKASCKVPKANATLNGSFKKEPTPDAPFEYEDYSISLNWEEIEGTAYYGLEVFLKDSDRGYTFEVYSIGQCGVIVHQEGRPYRETLEAEWMPRMESKVITKLYALDYHLYRYRRSLCNYSSGDPFGESVITYSNIEGGVGIFGAYHAHEKVLE